MLFTTIINPNPIIKNNYKVKIILSQAPFLICYNFSMMEEREIIQRLKEKGYVLSMPRIAILRYVLTHRTHHTAESIFRALKEEYPNISMATVYNTLKLLTKEGVVQQVMIDENKVIYDSNTYFHPHFKCRVCGKIEDIKLPFNFQVPEEVEGKKIEDVHIYLYGICEDCREKLGI